MSDERRERKQKNYRLSTISFLSFLLILFPLKFLTFLTFSLFLTFLHLFCSFFTISWSCKTIFVCYLPFIALFFHSSSLLQLFSIKNIITDFSLYRVWWITSHGLRLPRTGLEKILVRLEKSLEEQENYPSFFVPRSLNETTTVAIIMKLMVAWKREIFTHSTIKKGWFERAAEKKRKWFCWFLTRPHVSLSLFLILLPSNTHPIYLSISILIALLVK